MGMISLKGRAYIRSSTKINRILVYFCVFFLLDDHQQDVCSTFYSFLSPSHMYGERVKEPYYHPDYAHKVLLVGDSLFEVFSPVPRVQPSIICPRCQKRCHNMIMRLHTFAGDSCGKTPSGGIRWDRFTGMKWLSEAPAVRPTRLRGADCREATRHGLLRTETPDQIINWAGLCPSTLLNQ